MDAKEWRSAEFDPGQSVAERSRVIVVTPMESSFTAGTYADCLRLQHAMGSRVSMGPVHGGTVPDRLNLAVDKAREAGATHLGILEHDHRFPADAFHRLLDRDRDVVAANYYERNQRRLVAKRDGHEVQSLGRSGIEVVDSIGLGVMLIRVSIFDAIPEPWFSSPWMPTERRHMGWDVHFCLKARAHGFGIWVDHDLSGRVAHVAGDVEFWLDRIVYTQTGIEVPQ